MKRVLLLLVLAVSALAATAGPYGGELRFCLNSEPKTFHQLLVAMNTGPELLTGTGEGSGAGTSRRFDTGMTVVDEIVSHFITHSFLDPKDDRVLETILNQPIPGTPLKMRDLTDPQTLRQKLR